jgi:peroxiredoxin Q/BCP
MPKATTKTAAKPKPAPRTAAAAKPAAKAAAGSPAKKAVAEGSAAPKFALESDEGGKVSSGDFAGRWLVLYFYPRDNTPGCTREAQDFTKAVARLKKLGASVVGVSKDSVKSHCGFKEKIGIGFALLSDPDLAVHKAFGAYGTKVMYGKKVEGVIRSTFLVDPAGKLAKSWSGVKVDGHVEKVLGALQELQA